MKEDRSKLMLIPDMLKRLQELGVDMTPNACRKRLRVAMTSLAQASCLALGVELDEDELERVAGGRVFQEALANVLAGEDIY